MFIALSYSIVISPRYVHMNMARCCFENRNWVGLSRRLLSFGVRKQKMEIKLIYWRTVFCKIRKEIFSINKIISCFT